MRIPVINYSFLLKIVQYGNVSNRYVVIVLADCYNTLSFGEAFIYNKII